MSFSPPNEEPEDQEVEIPAVKTSYDVLSEAALKQLVSSTLDKRLRGAVPLIVLVETTSAAWSDALRRQFGRAYPEARARCYKSAPKRSGHSPEQEDQLIHSIQHGQTVIAVSTDVKGFVPEPLRHAADDTLSFNGLSLTSLNDAIGIVTKKPHRLPVGTDMPQLDLPELAATIRPHSSPNECLVRMKRAANRKADDLVNTSTVPPVNELPLTAPVRQWADQLLINMGQLERGEIGMQQSPFTLLGGPPGTGKTLLAESVAKAAGWRFVSTSAQAWFSSSDGYLGGVTKQLGQFFAELAEHPNTLGLIDELDAIPDRFTLDARNREWWTTLVTALLLHIDKLRRSTAPVVLLGASNYPERIDAALLRPQRISRVLRVEPPKTTEEVAAFFRFCLEGALADDAIAHLVDLSMGFGLPTPAQIADWSGSAKTAALGEGRALCFEDVARVMMGEDFRSAEDLYRVAIHEAGHAVIAAVLGVPIHSVSILAHGDTGGSVLAKMRSVDLDRVRVEKLVTVALAGRAADQVLLGIADAAASSDFSMATGLLVDAHHKWALYDQILVLDVDLDNLHQLDQETRASIEAMLQTLMERAQTLVRQHEAIIVALAQALVKARVISGQALNKHLYALLPGGIPAQSVPS